jgi:hypothetical protein
MRQYSNLVHNWPYRREINAGYRIRIEPARAEAADPAHVDIGGCCAVTEQN